MDELNHCSKVAEEERGGLEDSLKNLLKNEYSDVDVAQLACDIVQLVYDTYYDVFLVWYYYCYSFEDVLFHLDEELSDSTKAIAVKYFGSLSNYKDFLKENSNLFL